MINPVIINIIIDVIWIAGQAISHILTFTGVATIPQDVAWLAVGMSDGDNAKDLLFINIDITKEDIPIFTHLLGTLLVNFFLLTCSIFG